jgi:hypothetical protein
MSEEDLTSPMPKDRPRINVNESWQLEYWSKQFAITPYRLRLAVKAVGTSAAAVEAHINKK